ncbi:hypothetical protein BC567DRAFT_53823 [Phyllosticta citribraziliensis]
MSSPFLSSPTERLALRTSYIRPDTPDPPPSACSLPFPISSSLVTEPSHHVEQRLLWRCRPASRRLPAAL